MKMSATLEKLQNDVLTLSRQEQLFLARWLLDHAVDPLPEAQQNGQTSAESLLAMAGRFSGGPGDTAKRAEEILEAEVHPIKGFGRP
jgi:hypothetical protein